MKILFLASGSKGNATLIDSGNTLLLIDMGISRKLLASGVSALGRELGDIEGVLLTHEHSDHIKGIKYIAKDIPIYASAGTIDKHVDVIVNPDEEFEVGDFAIMPFSSSHDAANPLNFLIRCGKEKLGYVTDTGLIFDKGLALLKDCDYYLMESNHDRAMERKSKRPQMLIQRIMGDLGHLSNIDSASYICELIGPHTKGIYLGHLSDDCNTPELAIETYQRVFRDYGIDYTKYDIRCTSQTDFVKGGSWE